MEITELIFLFLRFADLQLKSVKNSKNFPELWKYTYHFIPNYKGKADGGWTDLGMREFSIEEVWKRVSIRRDRRSDLRTFERNKQIFFYAKLWPDSMWKNLDNRVLSLFFISFPCGCRRHDLYLCISIQLTSIYLHIYVYIYFYTFVTGGEKWWIWKKRWQNFAVAY